MCEFAPHLKFKTKLGEIFAEYKNTERIGGQIHNFAESILYRFIWTKWGNLATTKHPSIHPCVNDPKSGINNVFLQHFLFLFFGKSPDRPLLGSTSVQWG